MKSRVMRYLLFLAFIFFIFGQLVPALASTEPPAGFLNAPMLLDNELTGKAQPSGITVRQWANNVTEGTQFEWTDLGKGQWRLKSVEEDKLTGAKHTGIFLLVAEPSGGVRLSRMVVDDKELPAFEIAQFIRSVREKVQHP